MKWSPEPTRKNGEEPKILKSRKPFMKYYIKALKNYAKFDGRAHKAEFWYFVLFNLIISFALGFVGGMIGVEMIGNIYSLAILLPAIGVGVRRMHDVGKAGWYIIIPIYNIILAIGDGDSAENEYGPVPTDDDM